MRKDALKEKLNDLLLKVKENKEKVIVSILIVLVFGIFSVVLISKIQEAKTIDSNSTATNEAENSSISYPTSFNEITIEPAQNNESFVFDPRFYGMEGGPEEFNEINPFSYPNSYPKNITNSNYQYDFGDAPAPYPTLLKDNGAYHTVKGPYIEMHYDWESRGLKNFSGEPDGQPSQLATGDDSDESIYCCGGLILGYDGVYGIRENRLGGYYLDIGWNGDDAIKPIYLNAWFDLNKDGDWDDDGEFALNNVEVQIGQNRQFWDGIPTPTNLTNTFTYARFRVSTQRDLWYVGYAEDGEVEDYYVLIN
jgi:hypothetical protein